MILVGMGAESISQRHFQALARMSGYFLDVLQGLPILKLFDRSKGAEKAIIKDTPILLLDEPTAGLDVENETLVISAFE